MEDNGIILRMNDEGVLVEYEPYAEIGIETEEDMEKFKRILSVANSIEKAFRYGYILSKDGERISSTDQMIEVFKDVK